VKDNTNNFLIRRVALFIATIVSFLTPFMGSSVNIALPSIGKEFAMDAVLLSWVTSSFLLATAMFLVPFGRIADIYGRKKIFTYGILIYTISSFFLAISPFRIIFFLFRIFQGIGSAMMFGTGMAILTSVFPVEERGKVLGINVAAVYLGLSLGPFFGGFLTQNFGWRSIFLLNVPLGIIIIVLVFWKFKGEWVEAEGEKLDFAGSTIYIFTLLVIMYGFSILPSISGALLILIGVFGILTFIKWETKVKNPVLEINLFKKNTVFAFSNLAALINYSATFAVSFLLGLYLQYIKKLTPQNAGLILISQPFVQSIFSPFAGKLSDKIEPRIVASTGMILTTLGLFLFTFLDEKTPLLFIVISLIFLGFGFAFFSSPNTNAIMSSVEKRFYGVASGTLGTMRLLGQMLSMGIAMLVFAVCIGRVQITPEYYLSFLKSLKLAFIIFATLCFGGIFASLARGKVR
jgi:EmrB/QacA subfamily drug resistance transporter